LPAAPGDDQACCGSILFRPHAGIVRIPRAVEGGDGQKN
jgi:hypothetical protein